ncbi:MAG: coproporphyrinogen III oxidase [Candidatus Bathyarchaeota archaeon BA2]|nr:MAG: coproporphyrinogen III oxidase [Candidatus Bathyarchaeota archaeon BA2]
MKFSFINPAPSSESMYMVPTAWPPLGILYCAGVLMNEGIEVSILDQPAKRFSLNQTVNWVKKEDPDILGFSVLLSAAKEAPKIAERVKAENPNITIVFGNYHATFNPERILEKYPFVDVVARSEGEHTSLELARCLEKDGDLNNVEGIAFRKAGKIIFTPDRPLIKNVDELPFPDRNLTGVQYTSTIFGVKVNTKKFTALISSRGCPFRCSFCGIRKFARGRWRPRSVENVIEELELLQSEGYEQFLFADDNFTLNAKRVSKLCRKIRKERMDIEWFCDSRVDHVSYDMFREMVKAGCKCLFFGIESGNQRILDYYNKGITPEQAESAVRKARKAGIDIIVGSFIVGAPDETKREIVNTLQFANKLDIDVPDVNILGAHTGIDIWNDLVAKGFIDEEKYWETGVCIPKDLPTPVPYEEVRSLVYEYFRAFYLRPKQLLTEILRTTKSSFRIAAILNNVANFSQFTETLSQAIRRD